VNFLLWGLWHGVGLFIHNRWSAAFKTKVDEWAAEGMRKKVLNVLGIIVTFNYVAIGWVFFLLPKPQEAFVMIMKMFGV